MDLDGIGDLEDSRGLVLLRGERYDLTVDQEEIEIRSLKGTSRAPGPIDITGRISGSLSGSHVGQNVVLVLQDGRRWPCILVSQSGDLKSRGPIK